MIITAWVLGYLAFSIWLLIVWRIVDKEWDDEYAPFFLLWPAMVVIYIAGLLYFCPIGLARKIRIWREGE